MDENQAENWTSTAEKFRREVIERLDEGVTDLGELDSLVRIFSIAHDVASSVAQVGLKGLELELERYRIELAGGFEDGDEDECEVDATELEGQVDKHDDEKEMG